MCRRTTRKGRKRLNINQFYVAGGWKAGGGADEHGGKNEHSSQVYCHNSLKKEIFEKVCGIVDDIQ